MSRNVFDVPEERAREDYARNVGAHQRRIGGLKEAAELERERRKTRMDLLFKTQESNLAFEKNQRERERFPIDLRRLQSQIGNDEAQTDANRALAEQRRQPDAGRSPFRTVMPGGGIWNEQTKRWEVAPDPAAVRATRPPPASTASADARVSLGVVQRRIKDTQDQAAKRMKAIDDDYSLGPSTAAIAKQRVNQEARAELEKLKKQEDYLLIKMKLLAPDSEPSEQDSMEADGAGTMDSGEEDMVRIVTPDGRTGTIPASRLQEALEQGAKLVK